MNEIWAIILAAGESSRMKEPKMIMPFGEGTIIEKVLENIAGSYVKSTLIVLGAWKNEILQVLGSRPVLTCVNENYKMGMLSSVQCGIRNIPGTADGILVYPGDQPLVTGETINVLIDAFRKRGKGIVIPVFMKRRGHPVLLSSSYRNEILQLGPKNSLRDIMENHPSEIEEVEISSSSVITDIDTPDDYRREINQFERYGRDDSVQT